MHDSTTEPDVLARIQRTGPWALPDELAGLTASDPIVGGTATYGSGLVRFVVLPLSPRLAGQVLATTRTAGGRPLAVNGGDAWQLTSGAVTVAVARGADRGHAYLVAGLVTPDVVTAATRALLADPPPRRPA